MPPLSELDGIRKLAVKLATEGPHKVLPTSRRIRILFAGVYIVDTCEAKYIWEHRFYPQYYLPAEAFTAAKGTKIVPVEDLKDDNGKLVAKRWEIRTADRKLEKVIFFSEHDANADLFGYVKVDYSEADQWFEEDSPIFVHPKDPFKRVDLIESNRAIRVHIDGKKVAEAVTSIHLYETSLPVRFYMPLTAVDQSLLKPSKTRTQCPYKGESEYYDVVVGGKEHKDIVWFYNTPTIECAAIARLCCFYNEKVDIEIQEGGSWKKLERPKLPFS